MEQYLVTGMSCAACQARVEKAVRGVPGVESCSVSLLTNSMGVEGTASPAAIVAAVEKAGYGASRKDAASTEKRSVQEKLAAEEAALEDHETPVLRRRLIASVGFLLVLMWFSMGHSMWGWPVPSFFEGNHIGIALVQMLLCIIVMIINKKFFTSGFTSLLHGAPNMDSLIALGSAAAFAYSMVMVFLMTRGTSEQQMAYHHELYFESAAMILSLITVGKMLEARSKGKTTDALKSLMKMAPKTATILVNGKEQVVSVDAVETGTLFVVRPGEAIPVDGIVEEGHSAINEAALTGESLPVDKEPGDAVRSGTINQSGFLTCRATKVGEDTTLAQIIQMVSDAAATKAPVAKLADTISGYFVPVVIGIALLTTLVWILLGQSFGYALARGISVLVVSCPCALGLATPVAIMVGNGVGAKNGILFKTAAALQEAGRVQIVALDKTGTITKGEPEVTDIYPGAEVEEGTLLHLAASLEAKSEHPLAKAILKEAQLRQIAIEDVADFEALPGNGVQGQLSGKTIFGGNKKSVQTVCALPDQAHQQYDLVTSQGKTPLFFVHDGQYIGMIAVADVVKEDSIAAVQQLKNLGLHVVMLTGDNEQTAKTIGEQVGVNEVVAGVLPQGKEEIVRRLEKHGKVAMVGDGINDAPALTRAHIGVAIGAGTDVAIDAADVVLMKSNLTDVAAVIRLSRQTYKNILENLFWALFYNVLLIPFAAGAYVKAFGLTMNPMLGAAAMSLSSFCVVSNALRLNWFKLYDSSKDKPGRKSILLGESGMLLDTQEEEETMTKTMKIEGMMCAHCEATVKKALEAIEGVASAQVSHEAGTAVVTLTQEVDDAVLTKAVEEKDYQVLEVL